MSRSYRSSDTEFCAAVKKAQTYAELIRLLGYAGGRGIRQSLQRRISKLKLDASHLAMHKWLKGLPRKRSNREVPLDQVLVKHRKCDGHNLKLRLIRLGIFKRVCVRCKLTVWQGQLIPLSLDHIDGDTTNNTLENLQLLCENCHALTPTWRGKKRTYDRKRRDSLVIAKATNVL